MVFILVFLLLIAAYYLDKYSKQQKLFDNVAWCLVEGELPSHISSRHLYDCILYSDTHNKTVEPEYRLCVVDMHERDMVLEILDKYQKSLSEKYFLGKLSTDKYAINMPRQEYFMASLLAYLQAHECDTEFNGNVMYDLLEREDHGMWGSMRYTATYSIEPFGMVFTKLHYIVHVYCESSKVINKDNRISHCTAEALRENLSTKKVRISAL